MRGSAGCIGTDGQCCPIGGCPIRCVHFFLSRSRAVESSSSSLSDAQLSEHYTNCIKLSTQNVNQSSN